MNGSYEMTPEQRVEWEAEASQGSEYPAVVVPLTMSAYTLLQRNLLYTAVTRAKRLVVVAGSRKALAIAVRTAGTGRRHTALTHRLQTPAQPVRFQNTAPTVDQR